MKTTQKMIEVMQAHERGEVIQIRPLYAYYGGDGKWMDSDAPNWDWSHMDYRVKPKPREWWMCYDGKVFVGVNNEPPADDRITSIHVREIIDE